MTLSNFTRVAQRPEIREVFSGLHAVDDTPTTDGAPRPRRNGSSQNLALINSDPVIDLLLPSSSTSSRSASKTMVSVDR